MTVNLSRLGTAKLASLASLVFGDVLRPRPASPTELIVPRNATPMDREQRAYRDMLCNELAGQHGRYVVIVLDGLLGVFDTYSEAMAIGYRACGLTPFLIKRVPAFAAVALPVPAAFAQRRLEPA